MDFTKIAAYLGINPAQTQTPAITPVNYGPKTVTPSGLEAINAIGGDEYGNFRRDPGLVARLDAYDYPPPDRSGTYTKQFWA